MDPVPPGGAAAEEGAAATRAAADEEAALGVTDAAAAIRWIDQSDPTSLQEPPAPNSASSATGGSAMCPANKPFAMGIEPFLDNFASQHGATTWKQLDDPTQWQTGVINNLMDPDTTVLFNLDGVDVWGGIQRASGGYGGATDWELLQIYQSPDLPNLQFWRGGTMVQSPFVR